MLSLLEICFEFKALESHGHIFWCPQRFLECINRVHEVKESVEHEDFNGKTLTREETVFD